MAHFHYFTLLILIVSFHSSIVSSQKAHPNPLSTHILDTARGKAASNVQIRLYKSNKLDNFVLLNETITNEDGRVTDLIKTDDFTKGTYKLYFDTKAYFDTQNIHPFYPFVEIVFSVCDPTEHYHVPLLLSPFGYSTYRGT